ncbi:MAG: acetyl-CoA decarbonylase/synthase complex subunit delta [Fibrobacteres bacterium]|nr:acetyl-CoA decarbonylase/synthase complex subunit delta [Fibrobacterota bacterium]
MRFKEQGMAENSLDLIADETIASDPAGIKAFMTKVNHPALKMDDMAIYAQSEETPKEVQAAPKAEPVKAVSTEKVQPAEKAESINMQTLEALKAQILSEVKTTLAESIVKDIIGTLSSKYLGGSVEIPQAAAAPSQSVKTASVKVGPSAAERLSKVTAFEIKKESSETPVWEVKLGATKAEGGTRGKTLKIGGSAVMPFHHFEGSMPNRPLVAMEVFDSINAKFPAVLKSIYGDLLNNPAEMAKVLVSKYGADLISVRLEGTHPEKGDKSVASAVDLVKSVLAAVDVPLIITGHSHFEKNNEVLKAVAQNCKGENLLLNWVEQDNYRTIAGAAMAYGHTLVAQSPIDVNIGKQLNILLSNMDIRKEQIVMDPMTSAIGYGVEYTYSVMERIRITALGGDAMLCAPMLASPGQECVKIKEFKASESDFPMWGALEKRAAAWELGTATSLLYAGADLLIMYHPEAAMAAKRIIDKLMAN